MTSISIQYVSDLHLEYNVREPFENIVTPLHPDNYLVLAGDIAPITHPQLRSFLVWCSKNFKKVFYVSGNHEYYMKKKYTIDEATTLKRKLCAECGDNIIPLENEVYVLEEKTEANLGCVLVGTTLWADIDTKYAGEIYRRISDYRQIKDFMIPQQNEKHQESLKFLESVLDEAGEYKDYVRVVVTHHSPLKSEECIAEKYVGDPVNCAFATYLPKLLSKSDYWIFGHTHRSIFKIDENGLCVVTSNCRGYKGEQYGVFDPKKILSLHI